MTDRIEAFRIQLQKIGQEANERLVLHQQRRYTNHFSFSGTNGRLYIELNADTYDLILAGQLIERQMLKEMEEICGEPLTGYKQPDQKSPYWRVKQNADGIRMLTAAIRAYAMQV